MSGPGCSGADAAMERYACGDESSFAELYDALAPRLLPFIRRRLSDAGAAEDLLQQVFLQIHRGRASFVPGSEVGPWAFAIARRLMIDAGRRASREVPLAAEGEAAMAPIASREPGSEEVVHAREIAQRIDRVLADLPDTQRVAFELIRRDGLSIAEAAEVLGITTSAVKLRAHRAYEALRSVLGERARDGQTT